MNDEEKSLTYDLEEYQIPAVFRRVLKQAKLQEIVQITCKNRQKLTDHLIDKHKVFDHHLLSTF